MVKKNKATRGTIGQLAARMRVNVSAKSGVSNVFLDRFTRLVCSTNFKGVYSADYIPAGLAALTRFTLIVNLGERRGVRGPLEVGHFVTIVGLPDKMLYVDSFGLPSLQRHVDLFLKNCGRKVVCNERQLQQFDSVMCGLYAAMFAAYFDQERPFPLKFDRERLERNDKLCVSYLRRLI